MHPMQIIFLINVIFLKGPLRAVFVVVDVGTLLASHICCCIMWNCSCCWCCWYSCWCINCVSCEQTWISSADEQTWIYLLSGSPFLLSFLLALPFFNLLSMAAFSLNQSNVSPDFLPFFSFPSFSYPRFLVSPIRSIALCLISSACPLSFSTVVLFSSFTSMKKS
jgi:hypothetical protein